MIDFKDFEKVRIKDLNRVKFNVKDILKHDYIEQYIELAEKSPINFYNGETYQLQKKDIEKLINLKNLKDSGMSIDYVRSYLKLEENNKLSNNKSITGTHGFDKSMVSQGNKLKEMYINDVRETAVAVIFDILENHKNVTIDKILDILATDFYTNNLNFKPKIFDNNCKAIRTFLLEKNNLEDSYQCALGVQQAFEDSKMKGNYEIYHKSEAFSFIKKTAIDILKEVDIKCKPDKWNPADIFIIKKGFGVKVENDINEYNKQFYNFENIIGISLKKSENGALHGSAGLSTIEQLIDAKSKNFSKCAGVGNYGNKDGEEFLKEYIKDIQRLQQNCKKVVCYIDKSKNSLEDTMVSLKTDKGWKKCYMDLLDFLLKYSLSLDSAVTYLYNFANSTVDFSAPHYKVMGNNTIKVEPRMKNVKVVGIHIPLSDVRFIWLELDVEGEEKWLKGRPKNTGAKPQFMIDNQGMKTGNYKIVEGL